MGTLFNIRQKLFSFITKSPYKVYKGYRTNDGSKRGLAVVKVNGESLYSMMIDDKYLETPPVWDWGNNSRKANNLAVSILAEHTETNEIPQQLILLFRKNYIANLPHDYWSISNLDVQRFIETIERCFNEKDYSLNSFYNNFNLVLEDNHK